jgi:hypothetical protein
MIESYRDLVVWQKAMDLVADVCAQLSSCPRARGSVWFRS